MAKTEVHVNLYAFGLPYISHSFGSGKTISHWQKVFLSFKLKVSVLLIPKFNIQETFRYATLILERDFFFLVSVKSSSLISIH